MEYHQQPTMIGGYPNPCDIRLEYEKNHQHFSSQRNPGNRNGGLIDSLRQELPPTFTRQFVCERLGGLLNVKTLANLDSLREGPARKIRIGKKIGYERGVFLDWLEKRLKKA